MLETNSVVISPSIAADWVCLDIETGNAPEDAINRKLEEWKPPANVKDPEKIESRRAEAADKIRDKAALLDASPILCIAAVASNGDRVVFDGMSQVMTNIPEWIVVGQGNERDMLFAFREWLNKVAMPDETELTGHNINMFDIPKLRSAFIRHRLKIPAALALGRTRSFDLMKVFKGFSMEHRDNFYPSLDLVADTLGLEKPKAVISGADVPRLHEAGEYATIVSYCAIDTLTAAQAYLLMSGKSPELT